MPGAGHSVAEGVDPPQRVQGYALGVGEDHPRGADGRGDQARPDDAVADPTGCLVTGAADDGRSRRQTGRLRAGRRDVGGDLGRLEDRRQKIRVDVEEAKHLRRPAAVGHVEEKCARGVGDLGGEGSAQTEADVVLGQEEYASPTVDLRLVLTDPEEFGSAETGESRVTGEVDQPALADALRDPVTLGLGALVAPENGRPEHPVVGVEQHHPVHLSGEAYPHDLGRVHPRSGDRATDGCLGGVPPVLRVLFGPEGVGGGHRVLGGGRPQDLPFRVNHHRAGAAGPDIDAQEIAHRRPPGLSRGWRRPL